VFFRLLAHSAFLPLRGSGRFVPLGGRLRRWRPSAPQCGRSTWLSTIGSSSPDGACSLPLLFFLAIALLPVSWIQTRSPVGLTGISLDLGVSQGAGAVLRDFGAVVERP